MPLRPYQQRCVEAAVQFMRRSTSPWLIEAATGSGKSHVLATLAHHIRDLSRKRVLVLQPNAQLLQQNREKYLATGNPASVFSASAGGRCARHDVVFGTPGTVKNKLARFAGDFGLVLIDECHGVTPTVRHIIDRMREANPRLRVGGVTATPYRLGSGYIYVMREDGEVMQQARDPYFVQRVAFVGARELIDAGYLTPPVIGGVADEYDTSGLQLNTRGQYTAETVDRAFVGHGRKTSAIIGDVVAKSQGRKGVMIFAATIQHAKECLASLPPDMSAMVTGYDKTAIEGFRAGRVKYLVNVQVLTTGFDAPHVDVIAILRATESVGLLQQIIGRGLRIDDGKTDCLVLDYAGNIEKHCPDGDLFDPQVLAYAPQKEAEPLKVKCPDCQHINNFTARPNSDGYKLREDGYFADLDGNSIDVPSHYGRRCQALLLVAGEHHQCGYRWTGKECPACGADNDIAARYCTECKGEIVDPNEKLKADFKAFKKDPTQVQTDEVLGMEVQHTLSRAGNKVVRVDWTTPYRSFATWLQPEGRYPRARSEWQGFTSATDAGKVTPVSITYRKDPESKFYQVLAYNRNVDKEPNT